MRLTIILLFFVHFAFAQNDTIQNKYYIIELPEPALPVIMSYCIESIETVRSNNDKTKHVVKLPINTETPNNMQHFIEYDHTGIKIKLLELEWRSPE